MYNFENFNGRNSKDTNKSSIKKVNELWDSEDLRDEPEMEIPRLQGGFEPKNIVKGASKPKSEDDAAQSLFANLVLQAPFLANFEATAEAKEVTVNVFPDGKIRIKFIKDVESKDRQIMGDISIDITKNSDGTMMYYFDYMLEVPDNEPIRDYMATGTTSIEDTMASLNNKVYPKFKTWAKEVKKWTGIEIFKSDTIEFEDEDKDEIMGRDDSFKLKVRQDFNFRSN